MSSNNLQKNLKNLIKQGNHQVHELERQAGVRKNNVYNILHGLSKKPSAETLQAICNILGVSIQDLYAEEIKPIKHLDKSNCLLMKQMVDSFIDEIKTNNLKISCDEFLSIIKEIFDYLSDFNSKESGNNQADDDKLVKLMLKLKLQKSK